MDRVDHRTSIDIDLVRIVPVVCACHGHRLILEGILCWVAVENHSVCGIVTITNVVANLPLDRIVLVNDYRIRRGGTLIYLDMVTRRRYRIRGICQDVRGHAGKKDLK